MRNTRMMTRAAAVSALAAISLIGADRGFAASSGATVSASERAKIESVVHDYLMKHPEVVLDALQELDKRQEAEKAEKAKKVIAAEHNALIRDSYSGVIGNPKGDFTVVEVFDYNCGYCRLMAGELKDLIKSDPKIRIVLKEWPIRGPASHGAAKVSLAAAKQPNFQAFHFALLGSKGTVDEARALAVAKEEGLDMKALQRDMKTIKTDALLAKNNGLIRQLGIDGTPGFIIGDTIVPGATSLDHLRELIAKGRAACKNAANC